MPAAKAAKIGTPVIALACVKCFQSLPTLFARRVEVQTAPWKLTTAISSLSVLATLTLRLLEGGSAGAVTEKEKLYRCVQTRTN